MKRNDFTPLVAIMANERDVKIALHAVHNSVLNTWINIAKYAMTLHFSILFFSRRRRCRRSCFFFVIQVPFHAPKVFEL